MTSAEKLKNLLELEIMPDLEVAIDELFADIDKAKSASKEQKDDLEEMREMRTECFAIIEEDAWSLPLPVATESHSATSGAFKRDTSCPLI